MKFNQWVIANKIERNYDGVQHHSKRNREEEEEIKKNRRRKKE